MFDWKKCALATLGSAILAFGLYHVHAQTDITEGGVLGLTLLLEHWLHLSPAWSSLVMNGVCYAFGAWVLGRGFVLYSVISGAAFSLFYAVFERFPPLFGALHPLPAAVLGAVFVGIGVGLSVRAGGASGGDDALAMGLQKLTGWKIEYLYLISDLAVLLLSLSYIPLRRILYSLLTVVLSGRIIGVIQRLKINKT